ncbi:MAG: hypothetical protein OEU50_20240, partial [Gammaproteobacteria bacterium]|nr:hypothetical protein [Gammaproteobacteria bacterium]
PVGAVTGSGTAGTFTRFESDFDDAESARPFSSLHKKMADLPGPPGQQKDGKQFIAPKQVVPQLPSLYTSCLKVCIHW